MPWWTLPRDSATRGVFAAGCVAGGPRLGITALLAELAGRGLKHSDMFQWFSTCTASPAHPPALEDVSKSV